MLIQLLAGQWRHLAIPGRLHPAQHGFLPRAGTKPHALHFRLLLEDAIRTRTDLVLVMVDIRNAFGTLIWARPQPQPPCERCVYSASPPSQAAPETNVEREKGGGTNNTNVTGGGAN